MGVKHKVVDQNFDEDSINDKNPISCSQAIVIGQNKSARSLLEGSEDYSLPV